MLAAGFQLAIPHYIYLSINNLDARDELTVALQFLCLVAIGKSICNAVASTLGAKLEIRVRFALILIIMQVHGFSEIGRKITLVKEDAERVAHAIGDCLVLISSMALTLLAGYYLLRGHSFFSAPLVLVVVSLAVYFRYVRASVGRNYRDELIKDEYYKSSVAKLIFLAEKGGGDFQENTKCLADLVVARYKYETWNAIVSFFPEITIAVCSALVVLVSATFYPDFFTVKLIVYMSYLGIISMSSVHAIEVVLTFVGVDQSLKRIFAEVRGVK